MEIVCNNCDGRFRIADEKLPLNQKVAVKCAKCQSKIEIERKPAEDLPSNEQKDEQNVSAKADGDVAISLSTSEDDYDASSLLSSAYARAGRKTALVCEHDPDLKNAIISTLESLNYHVDIAKSTREALRHLRFSQCDVVVVDETFEASGASSNHVLQHMGYLPMFTRRHIFVVLVGNNFSTLDNMAAYHNSVNLVVNAEHINNLKRILCHGLEEHTAFYDTFYKVVEKTGRVI